VNEPCASFVFTISTATRPAPSNADTSSTNGARAAELRGRTTRRVGPDLLAGCGAVLGGDPGAGLLTGCALTPPP